MRGPLSVIAGFLLGVVVAGLVLGGILAFAPEPVDSTPAPISLATPAASATAQPSPSEASAVPSAVPTPSGSRALFHIGEPAPALSVPQVGGGTIDLASLRGQPVWVTFMATPCPTCATEFPLMNSYAARYASNGLVVIAVDVREDEGTVAAFAESLGATFPLGLDADGSAAQAWDAVPLPVHFWIDKDGIIRAGAQGGIGPAEMDRALETILGDVPAPS